MKDFSNRYIFTFSAVMVVSVAILLSLAAMVLQPLQERNVEVEKKMNILASINVASEKNKPLEEQNLPVFIAVMDKGDTLHIFPLEGKGLWGPIWGYVSLKPDMNTISGVTFDHKGETPGLGAEINTTSFEYQFLDKGLYEKGKFVSVKVVKGG